jgi:hypothetical protein
MFCVATECRDDAAFPMQDVAVFLKAMPRETDLEILEFRKELEERHDARVFHFDKIEKLQAQLHPVCSGWVRRIVEFAAG